LAPHLGVFQGIDPDPRRTMGLLAAFNHLLNFIAPALSVAAALVLLSHLLLRRRAAGRGWWRPWAVHSIVGCCVLAGGLVLQGRDGTMLTYAALVVACASSQWLWLRAWRG